MRELPEAPIDATPHLHMLPVLWLPDPSLEDVLLAGARRAGGGAAILSVPHADETVLIAARSSGVEVIVVVCDAVGAVRSMNAARRLGGLAVPVLALASRDGSPHLLRSCLDLLCDERLLDLNVPVPVIDDDAIRTGLWDELRAARVEERHHLVEVDGAPALVELSSTRSQPVLDPWATLAAGAAGVLAGRVASGNRRWRRPLA